MADDPGLHRGAMVGRFASRSFGVALDPGLYRRSVACDACRMSERADDPIAYHLVPRDVWENAPEDQPFRAASLETEGFVHLTGRMTELVKVGNSYYRDDPRPYFVLTIARVGVTAPWRYDGDERYPHVYGPIDRAAITEVRPIARLSDGTFLPIERPDERVPPDKPGSPPRVEDGRGTAEGPP